MSYMKDHYLTIVDHVDRALDGDGCDTIEQDEELLFEIAAPLYELANRRHLMVNASVPMVLMFD